MGRSLCMWIKSSSNTESAAFCVFVFSLIPPNDTHHWREVLNTTRPINTLLQFGCGTESRHLRADVSEQQAGISLASLLS